MLGMPATPAWTRQLPAGARRRLIAAMGMGLFDRLELFAWALLQLSCYGFAGLAALALLTRPRETSGLLLGERGLRAAFRLLGPAGEAASRTGGGSLVRFVGSIQSWANTLAERLLGSRDPAVTAGIWPSRIEDPSAPTAGPGDPEAAPHE